MEHKIPGNFYLVEVPEWNAAGYTVAQYYIEFGNGPSWRDVSADSECTSYVKSYKRLDKVGKMRPFATITI